MTYIHFISNVYSSCILIFTQVSMVQNNKLHNSFKYKIRTKVDDQLTFQDKAGNLNEKTFNERFVSPHKKTAKGQDSLLIKSVFMGRGGGD